LKPLYSETHFFPLSLVSTNKYYAPIDVLPEKLKEGKGKGLLHLEVVIKPIQ
jgi:hypothetical protein